MARFTCMTVVGVPWQVFGEGRWNSIRLLGFQRQPFLLDGAWSYQWLLVLPPLLVSSLTFLDQFFEFPATRQQTRHSPFHRRRIFAAHGGNSLGSCLESEDGFARAFASLLATWLKEYCLRAWCRVFTLGYCNWDWLGLIVLLLLLACFIYCWLVWSIWYMFRSSTLFKK